MRRNARQRMSAALVFLAVLLHTGVLRCRASPRTLQARFVLQQQRPRMSTHVHGDPAPPTANSTFSLADEVELNALKTHINAH